MSSSSQVTDFSDLYTDLSRRIRIAQGVTATENIAKSLINTALHDMHIGSKEKFPWAERTAVLRTQAQYTTGTVTVTKGSTTLTGSSTAWNTNNDFSVANMRAGGKIVIAGGNDVYEISAVASDTSATISTAFISSDVSADTYVYFEDEYALADDFLRPLEMRYFDQAHKIPLHQRRVFRERFVRNKNPGTISDATIIEKPFSGDTAPVRKVVFHNPPDTNYLIPYSYVTDRLAVQSDGTAAVQLVNDDDEPIVPLYARHLIVYHALYHWYRDQKNDDRAKEAKEEYLELYSRLIAEVEIGANRPQMRPVSYLRRGRRARGHHVTGSAFDELRE